MRVLPRLDEEHTGSALTDCAHIARAAAAVKPLARRRRPSDASGRRLWVRWLSTTCAVGGLVLGAPWGGLLWEPFLVMVHSEMLS